MMSFGIFFAFFFAIVAASLPVIHPAVVALERLFLGFNVDCRYAA
jgi:hypothetical protein